jgi:flagellar basal-body rod modification protein FlgD
MIPVAAQAAISAAGSLASLVGATGTDTTPQPAKAGDTVTQADFMQLLIAQLQNQDPLNPLDSANFSAQLAQFSSLQQLTEINQHLKDTAGTSGAATGFDAVGFLGKEVRGASDTATVNAGSASTLDYTLAAAGTVQAKVVDAAGRTVATIALGEQTAGAHTFDLAAAAGAPLADGTYRVELAVADAGGTTTRVATLGGGVVTGVDLSGESPILLVGDQRIALTDVREVKEHA